MHDQLNDGRRFCILAIVDDFTRECLALVADTRSPACESGARSMRLLLNAVNPPPVFPTTAPS
jgi:hypothetical protein